MATTIPKEGLRAIVAALTSLPAAYVIWDGEPKGPVEHGQDAKRIILNVVSRRAVGEDEEKREYPDPPGTVKTTYTGQRIVTISVRAENFGAEEGFDLLERLRVLLAADVNRAALNLLSLSLARTADVRNLDGVAGNRKISIAQMDIVLNQRVETIVTALGDTYIESVVTLAGELQGGT